MRPPDPAVRRSVRKERGTPGLSLGTGRRTGKRRGGSALERRSWLEPDRGEDVDAFSREHRAALTGQQFQSADNEPYYVLFEDFTHVKFYRRSLYDACVLEEATFDGFVHVDDWVPQRLVTASGPEPLPR